MFFILFTSSISSANFPLTSLDNPTPKIASTTISASIRLSVTSIPRFFTISICNLNSSVAFSMSPRTKMQMLCPKRYSILPMARPSAPLFPIPAMTCIVFTFLYLYSFFSIKFATLKAALSIKTTEGIPISLIVYESTFFISVPVTIFFISHSCTFAKHIKCCFFPIIYMSVS